ncbi:uncharacterized protein [Montipora foliosa]|uniref:uncharacterized protein n=1 Tax=Montipora foliosa TaxID=591990 RepID=UPI0035F12C72
MTGILYTLMLTAIVYFIRLSGISAQITPCPDEMITIVDGVSGNRTCMDCSFFSCPPGQGLTVKCGDVITPQTSISCKPCVLGETYSNLTEPGSCRDCMNCGKYRETKEACTLTSKAVCGKCVTGAYPEGLLGICVPCSHCCNDKDDVIIPGCQAPGVPENKRCTFTRSEKCSSNITREVSPSTTPPTTLAKAMKSPTRPSSVSHPPGGNKTEEGTGQGDVQEKQTQLETEGVESDRKKDSREKWIIGGCVSVAFLAAVVAIVILVRRLKQSRRKDQGDLIQNTPPEEDKNLIENTTPEKDLDLVETTTPKEDIGNETDDIHLRSSQKPPVKCIEVSPLPYPVEESKSGNIASEKGMKSTSCSKEHSPAKQGEAALQKKTEINIKILTQ